MDDKALHKTIKDFKGVENNSNNIWVLKKNSSAWYTYHVLNLNLTSSKLLLLSNLQSRSQHSYKTFNNLNKLEYKYI